MQHTIASLKALVDAQPVNNDKMQYKDIFLHVSGVGGQRLHVTHTPKHGYTYAIGITIIPESRILSWLD